MNHFQPEPQTKKDEINLFDLARILWNRWRLIVGGTLIATIAAVVISLLLPKVYEVSMIIEPGKASNISVESIKESIIGEAYDFKIKSSLNVTPSDYPKLNVRIPKGTSLVKISVETSHPELSEKILELMSKFIAEDIESRLEIDRKDIENQIKTTMLKNIKVDEMVDIAKKQIDDINKKIIVLEKNKLKAMSVSSDGAMSVLLYSNEIQNQQIYLNSLVEKLKNYEEEAKGGIIRIDNLRLQIDRLKGMNIVKPVTVSDKPVKPRKTLIVFTTFFATIFGMSICALIMQCVISDKSKIDN